MTSLDIDKILPERFRRKNSNATNDNTCKTLGNFFDTTGVQLI